LKSQRWSLKKILCGRKKLQKDLENRNILLIFASLIKTNNKLWVLEALHTLLKRGMTTRQASRKKNA
jgi:hypothetical protein